MKMLAQTRVIAVSEIRFPEHSLVRAGCCTHQEEMSWSQKREENLLWVGRRESHVSSWEKKA